MAVNIAGVIVIGVLIVVLTVLARTSIVSTTLVGFSTFQGTDLTGARARTKLEFVSAQGGAGDLTLNIKNTGLTSVFNFAGMDVIVDYVDSSDIPVSTHLTYTTGVLANNEWKKTSITPDTYQPNAWNPNETITLDALISPIQKPDSTATVSVVTPNGVAVIWSFGPSGFFWLVSATDISAITIDSWKDIDLSAHVPVGTTGAIVELVNIGTSDNLSGMVRGKEDSRNYMSNSSFGAMTRETHRWQIVKVDSNRVIQGYIEDREIDFKLRGYTLGTDPSYFNTPFDVTPSEAEKGTWANVDVSGYVDANADGVILLINNTDNGVGIYGIREVGSSFPTPVVQLPAYGNTMYLVGINGSDQFQAWIESVEFTKVYLVGETKGSVVYYTNDLAVADPSTGSWQEVDADTSGVAAEANGLIFRVDNDGGSDRKAGFRHGDSTDDWNGDIEGDAHLQAGTGINSDNVWDEYIENASLDVHIAAYTKTTAN